MQFLHSWCEGQLHISITCSDSSVHERGSQTRMYDLQGVTINAYNIHIFCVGNRRQLTPNDYHKIIFYHMDNQAFSTCLSYSSLFS